MGTVAGMGMRGAARRETGTVMAMAVTGASTDGTAMVVVTGQRMVADWTLRMTMATEAEKATGTATGAAQEKHHD